MLVPYIILLGAWAFVRATAEARIWLTYLRSAGPARVTYLREAATAAFIQTISGGDAIKEANNVSNFVAVAESPKDKAKITASKRPGSGT